MTLGVVGFNSPSCGNGCAGPSGRLAEKLRGLDSDGLVSPGTILNSGDVVINMQVSQARIICC